MHHLDGFVLYSVINSWTKKRTLFYVWLNAVEIGQNEFEFENVFKIKFSETNLSRNEVRGQILGVWQN